MIGINKKLKAHIRNLEVISAAEGVASVGAVSALVLGIASLFSLPDLAELSLVCAVIFVVCISFLIILYRVLDKQERYAKASPVLLEGVSALSYEEARDKLTELVGEENFLHFSSQYQPKSNTPNDVDFFLKKGRRTFRVILYSCCQFDKPSYDKAKKSINRAANKKFNIPHTGPRNKLLKNMRYNVIYAKENDGELLRFMSQNAEHELSRIEGILNIAVTDGNILIPPLYGRVGAIELKRYKRVIKHIESKLMAR